MCEHPLHMKFCKSYPLNWNEMPENWQKFYTKGRFVTNGEYNQLKDLDLLDEENIIDIPCGYCAECKLQQAADKATRIYMETLCHKENCFVTFTYRPKDLPKYSQHDKHIYIKTGNLIIRDMQLFFKKLIKKYPNQNIRRFYSGEYGPKRKRPHYHAIICGYIPKDLVYWKDSESGEAMYKSAELQNIWGHGFVTVQFVTIATCGYTARYTMKKAGVKPQKRERKPNPYYREGGKMNKWLYPKPVKNPEFVCSSRRPGIGRLYWEQNINKIKRDKGIWVFEPKLKHVVLKPIPRNFREIWKKSADWENYYRYSNEIKREFEEYKQKLIKEHNGESWEEIRRQQIEELHERIKKLKRTEEFDLNYEYVLPNTA